MQRMVYNELTVDIIKRDRVKGLKAKKINPDI